MPSQENVDLLQQIHEKKDKSKSVVFTHYRGLTVNDMTQLRAKLREAGGEMLVTKNTLLRIAFGNEALSKDLVGPTAAIFAYDDEISPLKVAADFVKGHDVFQLTAGYLDGRALTADEVKQLAKLPGKQEMRAQLVGTLAAPLSGFVNVLQGNIRGLVYALKAISEKKSN